MPTQVIVMMPDAGDLTPFFDAVARSQVGRAQILTFGLRHLRLVYATPADAAAACLVVSDYYKGCRPYP